MRFICIIASKARFARAGIGTADQPHKLLGNDLPRHAKAVFHPTALLGLGDGRKHIGEAIDLGLGLYRYLERDGFVELEMQPAIEAGKWPAPQGKLDQQYVSGLAGRVVARRAMNRLDMASGTTET